MKFPPAGIAALPLPGPSVALPTAGSKGRPDRVQACRSPRRDRTPVNARRRAVFDGDRRHAERRRFALHDPENNGQRSTHTFRN